MLYTFHSIIKNKILRKNISKICHYIQEKKQLSVNQKNLKKREIREVKDKNQETRMNNEQFIIKIRLLEFISQLGGGGAHL